MIQMASTNRRWLRHNVGYIHPFEESWMRDADRPGQSYNNDQMISYDVHDICMLADKEIKLDLVSTNFRMNIWKEFYTLEPSLLISFYHLPELKFHSDAKMQKLELSSIMSINTEPCPRAAPCECK